MHDFKYKNSELYAGDVPVGKIAGKVGTPLYIYSHKTFLRSEEHTSELQSHSFISYAVFCLKKKN